MEITTKKVKLSAIRLNPDNPRMISKKDMDLLVKSLADFPEMMELREIVVDENLVCIGGNMRTLALRKVGAKEATAKIVTGLTPEQKREFVIKDNGGFGSWDMDLLSSLWDDLPLVDWGIKISGDWLTKDNPEGEKGPSDLSKNFNAGYGGQTDVNETPIEAGPDGKYPVTFILDQSEWEQWEIVKERLKIRADKPAFLKIIGG